tara:strand:+ start:399 stop:848 length:450 start_codon:yes stop_codon:yes gene_type:complete
MIKKICLIILFIGVSSCDYKPVYQQKTDLNLLIKEIQLEGNKNINRKVIKFLKLKDPKNKSSGYILKLNSTKKLAIISKDKAGDASLYRTTVTISVLLNDKNKIIKQKIFSTNFVYNNISNKFDLAEYQKNVETTLINQLIEDIYIFLN